MKQRFRCLTCDGPVDLVDITGNWATVECVDCGVHSVEVERPEGQGSLFGRSIVEHVSTFLLIMAVLLSVTVILAAEAGSGLALLRVRN